MATKETTIEYMFPTNVASLAAATRRDFAAQTIYLPSGLIGFNSVVMEVTAADDAAAAASVTSVLMGIKLGAVAFSDVTTTDTITNSGEAQSYRFLRDITAYFAANWSGTSMTCQVGVQFGGAATQNHTVKLIITYTYDDADATQMNTVRIPIESTRTNLTTTLQTVGGATAIPALTGSPGWWDAGLSGRVIRQIWIELWGNEEVTATTDFTLVASVNGGPEQTWWDAEAALQSSRWAYGALDITAEDLSSARSLECRAVGVTARGSNVGGMVCVTYEYDYAASTREHISLMLGAVDTIGAVGTALSNIDRWRRSISVQETNPTLLESGVALFYNSAANCTFNVRAGAQAFQTHTQNSPSLTCGQYSLVHRLDAGGRAGSSAFSSFAHGFNEYTLDFYSQTGNAGWNLSGFMLLNYSADKSPNKARTCWQTIAQYTADTFVRVISATNGAFINPANYWLVGAMVYLTGTLQTGTAYGIAVNAERLTGEADEAGYEPVYAGFFASDNENNFVSVYGAARSAWKRHPGDLDANRMDIETSRRWKVDTDRPLWLGGLGMYFTYHTHQYAIAGDVTGSAGGTVTITAFRADTHEPIGETTRVGDGPYSIPWYDNTVDVYTVAEESGTHLARSATGLAA